jgi:hypothetical protein
MSCTRYFGHVCQNTCTSGRVGLAWGSGRGGSQYFEVSQHLDIHVARSSPLFVSSFPLQHGLPFSEIRCSVGTKSGIRISVGVAHRPLTPPSARNVRRSMV